MLRAFCFGWSRSGYFVNHQRNHDNLLNREAFLNAFENKQPVKNQRLRHKKTRWFSPNGFQKKFKVF